jgi:hypothetical protein
MLAGDQVTDRIRASAREMLVSRAKGEAKSKGESESGRPGKGKAASPPGARMKN